MQGKEREKEGRNGADSGLAGRVEDGRVGDGAGRREARRYNKMSQKAEEDERREGSARPKSELYVRSSQNLMKLLGGSSAPGGPYSFDEQFVTWKPTADEVEKKKKMMMTTSRGERERTEEPH